MPPFHAYRSQQAHAFDELSKALCQLIGDQLDTAFQLARADQLPNWVPATGPTAKPLKGSHRRQIGLILRLVRRMRMRAGFELRICAPEGIGQ